MLFRLVDTFITVMYYGIIARVVVSYFPDFARRNYQLVEFIYRLTDPIMIPVESFTSKYLNLGMIDISPMIALMLLHLFKKMLFSFHFGFYY